jgi:formylglycine-generating enzyme required for sulfatase activity/KaiC/GvpD/RAD55 family RecA-like ATPase
MKEALVEIKPETRGPGSGFVVYNDVRNDCSYVLTCKHVVGDDARARIDKVTDGEVIFRADDPNVDLAVLRCSGNYLHDRRPLDLREPLELRSFRILANWSYTALEQNSNKPRPAWTQFRVAMTVPDDPDTIYLHNDPEVKISSGHSGSPVIDDRGSAVGVVRQVGAVSGEGDSLVKATSMGAFSKMLSELARFWKDMPPELVYTPRIPTAIQLVRSSSQFAAQANVLIAGSLEMQNELAIVAETVWRTSSAASGRSFPVELLDLRKLVAKPDDIGEAELKRIIERAHGSILVVAGDLTDSSWDTLLRRVETLGVAKPRLTYRIVDHAEDENIVLPAGSLFHTLAQEGVPFIACTPNALADRIWDDYQRFFSDVLQLGRDPRGKRTPSAPEAPRNPYPGLRSYSVDEAAFFHGRANEVSELRKLLAERQRGLVAVVGPSGCGKSSLVRAGLCFRLEQDAIRGSSGWKILEIRLAQEGDAMTLKAKALAPLADRHSEPANFKANYLVAKLFDDKQDDESLQAFVKDAIRHLGENGRLVLFFDQFEEFFTLLKREDDTFAYLRRIRRLAELADVNVNVIITIRGDFYTHLMQSPLQERPEAQHPFWLRAADARSLLQAICLPVAVAGYSFEDNNLVRQILLEAGVEAGSLPLLSYALNTLVDRCQSTLVLTWEAYNVMKGVTGVIQERAEIATNSVKEEVLQALFLRMITVDPQTLTATRKPAYFDPANPWPEAEVRVMKKLVDERLLLTDAAEAGREKDSIQTPATGPVVVQVAHEALLTHWPQLVKWLEKSKEYLVLKQSFETAVRDWIKARAEALKPVAAVAVADGSSVSAPPAQWELELKAARDHIWREEKLRDVRVALRQIGVGAESLSQDCRLFLQPETDRRLQELTLPILHEDRISVGSRLAELKDTRRGVGLLRSAALNKDVPDFEWCAVPGGEVAIYGDDQALLSRAKVEPFYIARYPVTIRQFEPFLEKPGYFATRWWNGLDLDGDANPIYQQKSEPSNHPAQYISWYQAIAYARWASELLGYEVRIPTEWEFVQAFTGGDPARIFPWGETWDPSRANHAGGARVLMSVGMYPQGAAPCGALDLSGNVYQWCLNEHGRPESVGLAGTGLRVSRGGSYFDGEHELSVRYRRPDFANGYNDQKRRIVVAIRLVSSLPPKDSIFTQSF